MKRAVSNKTVTTTSPEETHRVAADLLKGLGPGTVLALHGELGAGKTCFVQGLAQALGVKRAVSSPTFTLVNEYPGPLPLYHIDLYRIGGVNEAFGLGIEEYLESEGITAIEWAERVAELLPASTIHIRMVAGADPDERTITIERGGGT